MVLAVSACLLGEKVRYDGGHRHDEFIAGDLGRYATLVPFCPENPAFGTPRPSVRLVSADGAIRVRTNQGGADVTEALQATVHAECDRLAAHPLCGILFKARSPSCGLKSTPLYRENGMGAGKRDGLFASECRNRFPLLPMEEEGRLQDPWLRENFVMQLFAYHRFEEFKRNTPSMEDLVRFHTAHALLLQSKNEMLYRQLGRLVANPEALSLETLLLRYELLFKTAIAHKNSIKRTRNLLEHLAGFFKNELSRSEKEILHGQIRDYADRLLPLIVPVSTIHLCARTHNIPYLLDQAFLDPYPITLALRFHPDGGT